jgi:hypothetical protein
MRYQKTYGPADATPIQGPAAARCAPVSQGLAACGRPVLHASPAQRAIGSTAHISASTYGRTWHGYAACQHQNLALVLTIFKVADNYRLTDAKGSTSAMKLGLEKGPWHWKT